MFDENLLRCASANANTDENGMHYFVLTSLWALVGGCYHNLDICTLMFKNDIRV